MGTMFLLLNAATIFCRVSSEIPEKPLARILIRKAKSIRARSIDNGSPTPAQCETIKRVCNSLEEKQSFILLSQTPPSLTLVDRWE